MTEPRTEIQCVPDLSNAQQYYCRCGWCGAYEGTVPSDEPCRMAVDAATGSCLGPHQFEVYEPVEGPTMILTKAEREDALDQLKHAMNLLSNGTDYENYIEQ